MSAPGPGPGSGPPPHGGGGSGLSPFGAPVPLHAPLPPIPAAPLGAGAGMMPAVPVPVLAAGVVAPLAPPVAVPAAPARNALGLRPVDDALTYMRERVAMAPHSGALFQDQHRNNPVSGYPSQAPAHQALIASATGFAAQATAAAPPSSLATAVHMASSQLHVSLPGPELAPALDHGFPALAQPGGNGNLKTPAAVAALASDIHERREHAKANVFDAAEQLSPMSRARVALPSPRRESMAHGGGYIDAPPMVLPAPAPAAAPPADVGAERQLARSLLTPLAEPNWTAPVRGAGVAAAPHHGAGMNQARDAFMLQAPHTGEVGREATAHYIAGEVPTDAQVRVDAVPSASLHPGIGAGAHEVVPTELSDTIAAMPDHIRTQMAHAQADVRTSTALTFLRGGPPGGGGGGGAAAAAAAPAAGAGPDPPPTRGTKRKKPPPSSP